MSVTAAIRQSGAKAGAAGDLLCPQKDSTFRCAEKKNLQRRVMAAKGLVYVDVLGYFLQLIHNNAYIKE